MRLINKTTAYTLLTTLIVGCLFIALFNVKAFGVAVTGGKIWVEGGTLTIGDVPEALVTSGLVENVQYGSLVFNGSSQLSTSTTISSVDTSRSVVIFNGFSTTNASINGMESDAMRLWLTDATTVTGTRGGGDTHTVTVNFAVIQFASGITDSIQQVLITNIGTAQSTTTISSVDTSRSIAIWGGGETDDTTYNRALTVLNLASATEITATRTTGANASTTATVVEFAAGVTDSVQQVSIILGNTIDQGSATISSVTTADTMLFYGGSRSAGTATDLWHGYMYLLDSTTVMQERRRVGTGVLAMMTSVVDFNSTYLNSASQRGQNLIGETYLSTTTPISTVTISKSILQWLGHFRGPVSTGGQTNRYSTRIEFQDASNLVTTRAASVDNASTSWHIIESK